MDGSSPASVEATAARPIDITGLTSDSRRVAPGYLFAALPGTRFDGRAFIGEALARGAAAVLAPEGTQLPAAMATHVPLIVDANPHRRLALFAARFFGRQPETVCAVTGTNGKTSVVWFLWRLWTLLGRSAAALGTLGVQAPGVSRPGNLTTPDPVELHETLAMLADAGVDRLAMEASSHGLAQYRLDGVRLAAAAFTNVSRDHLDYHGSMAAYRAAKLRLFTDLLTDDGAIVLDPDAAGSAEVIAAARARGLRLLTVGSRGETLRLVAAEPRPDGQRLTIDNGGRTRHTIMLPLVGGFQATNALSAAALAIATGEDSGRVVSALVDLEPVPGRLQRVAMRGDGAAVYVDYAHTPDALATVLDALRPHTPGRLAVVLGCGGDRDAGKRPLMGAAAADRADLVIVTDDNPRGEDPAAIRRQVLAACPTAREIGNRREAIEVGIADLAAGDVLLVAGKGHETGQIVGDRVLPFDDAVEIRRAVEAAGW
jgi:UDP-N-acetylmuramoyl-L-alanyl-D-glutamate--2,6-diaminopimelate ligase